MHGMRYTLTGIEPEGSVDAMQYEGEPSPIVRFLRKHTGEENFHYRWVIGTPIHIWYTWRIDRAREEREFELPYGWWLVWHPVYGPTIMSDARFRVLFASGD